MIKFQKKFPNIIVFTHSDMDGLFSAMIIKNQFDNNLQNNAWERNVQTYICKYGETLDWFKEKVNESYVADQQNIIYMTDYSIQPNDDMLKFWNWLTDKNCKFYWIDHHITAIENLKHLNIPGLQQSAYSGCMNTWHNLMGNQNIPMAIKMANDFDTWNKESIYSWQKQLYPLMFYVESLGTEINNNQGELVQSLQKMLIDNEYTNQCISIGKYIYRFVQNKYKSSTKKIYSLMWNNLKCLLINSSFKGSTQFEEYNNENNELGIKTFKDADMMICWSFNGTQYNYSFYSTKPNINCGKLAEQFIHGGGHQSAAGGYSDQFIFKIQ